MTLSLTDNRQEPSDNRQEPSDNRQEPPDNRQEPSDNRQEPGTFTFEIQRATPETCDIEIFDQSDKEAYPDKIFDFFFIFDNSDNVYNFG